MNCRDFQREVDALLDAGAGVSPAALAIEARLIAHAEDCPVCRPILVRYQTLRRAIDAWMSPPSPPADLVDRVLAVPDDLAEVRRPRLGWAIRRGPISIAAGLAAGILLLVTAGILRDRPDRPTPPAPPISTVRAPQSAAAPALDRALADATSATIALARSASGPAARVGRELLVAVEPPEESSIVPAPLDPIGAGTAEAAGVLQRVGDEVAAGVRPLSSSARHAFGFLLGAPRPAGSRPPGSTPNGARNG